MRTPSYAPNSGAKSEVPRPMTLSPVTYASEISVTAPAGEVFSGGCTELGIVGYSWFANYMSGEITQASRNRAS